jgi:hypothetical protein
VTAATRLRVPAGDARGRGGQFAAETCPVTYRRLVEAFRPAVDLPRVEESMPQNWRRDPANEARTVVLAPRCAHGRFRACKDCARGL